MTIQMNQAQKFIIADSNKLAVGENLNKKTSWSWKTNPQNPIAKINYNRIWCVLDGEGFVQNSDGKFKLEKGYTYLVPANSIIQTECSDYMVQFFVDFLQEGSFSVNSSIYEVKFSIKTNNVILDALTTIQNKLSDNDSASEFAISGAIFTILSFFITNKISPSTSILPFVDIINFINENYTKNITIEDLTKIAGYSQSHFIFLFKKLFNTTPMNLIKTKRIALAQEYLYQTNKSILEIAELCGYPDQFYFSRLFSKLNHCSPSEFRQKYKKQL